MSVIQYLDYCNDPNWQVVEEGKKNLDSSKGSRENESQSNKLTSEQSALESRVRSLKYAVSILKAELLEEKALWKKEVELTASLISSIDRHAESEINSDAEVDMKSIVSLPVASTDALMPCSPIIRDLEEKLSRYQGALAQAHAEKRLNIRRQIAANTYRKRLHEVEKLCQEELNKVRETATYLEPLKQIASEWSKPKPCYIEPMKSSPTSDKMRRKSLSIVECGGDCLPAKEKEVKVREDSGYPYEVPVKQIDASLVMDEDASSEIKGKIVLQIGSLPTEVPTICYSAKFE